MRTSRLAGLIVVALLVFVAPALTEAAKEKTPPTPPTILALTEPPDGAVLDPRRPPTFAWEATPGGRFHVEFSSSNAPFIPVLTSGRRTTPGDRYKPSMKQWRQIRALGAATGVIYWRVVALHMTPAQIELLPISSFSVQP